LLVQIYETSSPESVSVPVIIAGGLGPDNVADAIRAVQPAGVDSKTKTDKFDGSHVKDLEKVRRFVSSAKACSRHGTSKRS
jgi:phosphoribosylanthranilate isomerase